MPTKRLGFLILVLTIIAAAQAFGGPEDDAKSEGKKDAAPAPVREYVGGKTCKKCHFKQHKTWSSMAHAGAWEALPEEHRNATSKDDFGRACATCHTTGFGATEQKGFVDPKASEHLLGVQCEACHGPGHLHAAAAKKLKATKVEGKNVKRFAEGQDTFIDKAGKDCRACHNPHYSYKKKYGKKDE